VVLLTLAAAQKQKQEQDLKQTAHATRIPATFPPHDTGMDDGNGSVLLLLPLKLLLLLLLLLLLPPPPPPPVYRNAHYAAHHLDPRTSGCGWYSARHDYRCWC
jgi:hypothetical protein